MSRAKNIQRIVSGVVRQAVVDAGATGVFLIDDGSHEAELVSSWLKDALGAAFVRATASRDDNGTGDRPRAQEIARERGLLTAHPINKTALLLSPVPVPEVLLPLGDLYASDVRELAGDWRGPENVRTLEALCGGIDVLDAALRARFEERKDVARVLALLPAAACDAFEEALEAGRFARNHVGLVPKLGTRTPGIDLFA